jgi:hypothetical protein
MTEKKQKNAKSSKAGPSPQLLPQVDNKTKYVDIFLFFLLLLFGIYHAVIYWGHQVVPHFDFNCFAIIGRELLAFQMPCTFKRVPLVGILQVLFGHITGGAYPDLNGGWLLNSIMADRKKSHWPLRDMVCCHSYNQSVGPAASHRSYR